MDKLKLFLSATFMEMARRNKVVGEAVASLSTLGQSPTRMGEELLAAGQTFAKIASHHDDMAKMLADAADAIHVAFPSLIQSEAPPVTASPGAPINQPEVKADKETLPPTGAEPTGTVDLSPGEPVATTGDAAASPEPAPTNPTEDAEQN